MSSLQKRLRGTPGVAGIDSSRNGNTSSFEKSFSNGLDLSELMPPSGAPTSSAASELIKIKAQAAVRSKWEEKEEAALEKRIADVHSTKVYEKSVPSEEIVLRAANPLSSDCAGSERNNNFLQFENGCSSKDNGFLSSLVQNHNSERKEFAISQRTSSSKRKIASRAPSNTQRAMNSGRLCGLNKNYKSGSGTKVLAKKARKSKF
eukprot:CCRYP_019034-RA/>CCRYP_019034-RA protein AED:0.00 eAED:0.00 QI:287/1/1/1/0/0/2/127/204